MFMKWLVEDFGKPTILTTNQDPALLRHFQRHFVNSAGFKNPRHASRTLKGIETIHVIYKQKRSHMPDFSFFDV